MVAAWDMLKNDVEKITLGLEQTMEKLAYTVDFRGTLLKEKDWRSIVSLPLEYHIELASHAYDVGNFKIFEDISNSAFIRCKYR